MQWNTRTLSIALHLIFTGEMKCPSGATYKVSTPHNDQDQELIGYKIILRVRLWTMSSMAKVCIHGLMAQYIVVNSLETGKHNKCNHCLLYNNYYNDH